ncbi:multiple sugar transport system permease protein [Cellulosimicrobium cellulans]|jgi:multiple sugar transport system permease protein|uniref:ABC transporter permease n=2 Tax=Cellulosimicrobium TaxID=157920 RepID=A0A1Y0HTP9_CELCE|nr:carbohydrate ABC transporter permease [Cellulosimicrobium cellulans]ARU51531.1 ABC transporter permease [Cellulosimicrobium cellulans]MBM7817995.1 multiple sugar transport system permease protein [Cellulosimicrobium cellulans]
MTTVADRTQLPDVPALTPRRRGTPAKVVVARVVVGVLLVGYAVVSLYPFLWMVSAAFKTQQEIVMGGGNLIPAEPTLSTLVDTWSRLHFFDYFLNSVKVTGLTTLGVVVVYSAASYAFAVLRFPGRQAFFRLFLVLLFVPGVVTLLPIVLLENQLGILGTHLGLILPFVNGTAPLSILLLTNAFQSVPGELRDAARVDGAGELRIFARVYVPLARPAIITIALLTAIPTWNEYLLSRVSLNDPSTFTLPIALQQLQSSNVVQYNQLMAGALIVVIPVIILFLATQRYFVNGLVGAVKG